MTLRDECEALARDFLCFGVARTVAVKVLERFAKRQQAVGLREAATEGSKVIAAYADGVPASQLAKWCEQRAREREGA